MNPFFEWLIKSSVSIALLYSVYKLAVSRDKIFLINRFVLLGILLLSALLPLLDVPIFQKAVVIPKIEVFRDFVTPTIVSNASIITESVSTVKETESFQINPWLVFYLVAILALSIRLLVSVFRVIQIIRKAEKQPFQKIILAIVKDFIQPFSFLQHIIISEKDYSENRDIVIAHEYAHIKHLHVIDLLICELFTAIHWFNPLMWLLRRDLKLIHEYQADQAVLNKGIDAKKYQLLVVEKAVGERRFAMANHFTQKPILKRIKMMHRKNENYWKGVKLIFFAPVVLLLLQAFAQPEAFVEKAKEIVPNIQVDKTNEWLGKWNIDNIENSNLAPKIFDEDVARKDNNVLAILINRNDDFLIENQRKTKDDVKAIVKNFLNGKNPDGKNGPDLIDEEIPDLGKMKVSKGAVSVRNDLGTSDEILNFTLKSIGEAYLEVRKEKAENLFGEDYFKLDDNKQKAIDLLVPIQFVFEYRKGKLLKEKAESNNSGINQKMVTVFSVIISGNDRGDLDEIREKAENAVKNSNGDISANIMSYIKISEEDINSIKEVLQQAGIKKISQVKPPPPPPPAKIELILKKDGNVLWGKEEYSISELEQKIITLKKEQEQTYKKYNMKSEMITSLKIEDGVTEEQMNAFREVLRKANVSHINYSTNSNDPSASERSGEVKPPPPPPPPGIIELTLKRDGQVLWGKDEYSIAELEQKIVAINKEREEVYKRNNRNLREMITSVKIEDGVTDEQITSLKEALRRIKALHVNYSTDSKEQSSIEQSGNIKKDIKSTWEDIEQTLSASNRGIINIGNNSFQLERSILGNESTQNSGKFEFDIFTTKDDKKVQVCFLSIKSLSQDSPNTGKYEYVSGGYNQRNENTFWGIVKIEDNEYEISKGKLEILNNSEKNFIAEFKIELSDGTKISGKHQGVIQKVDWRKMTAQN